MYKYVYNIESRKMSTETSTPVNTTEERFTGRVKWFNNKAGYGFITLQTDTNDVNDIFVHHSGITTEKEQFKYLVEGEYVEFQTSVDGDKTVAVKVCGPGSGKLMCETREENRRSRLERRRERQPQEHQDGQRQTYRNQHSRHVQGYRTNQRFLHPRSEVRQVPLYTTNLREQEEGFVVVPARTLRPSTRGRGGRGRGRGVRREQTRQ